MLKHAFTYFLFSIAIICSAQTSIESELDSITNYERALEFIKSKDFKQNKFIVFNEERPV